MCTMDPKWIFFFFRSFILTFGVWGDTNGSSWWLDWPFCHSALQIFRNHTHEATAVWHLEVKRSRVWAAGKKWLIYCQNYTRMTARRPNRKRNSSKRGDTPKKTCVTKLHYFWWMFFWWSVVVQFKTLDTDHTSTCPFLLGWLRCTWARQHPAMWQLLQGDLDIFCRFKCILDELWTMPSSGYQVVIFVGYLEVSTSIAMAMREVWDFGWQLAVEYVV